MRLPTFALAACLQLALPQCAEGQEEPLVVVGKFQVEESGVFRRLLGNGILLETQIKDRYLHRMDTPIPFGAFNPWEVLLLEGTLVAWDPRLEPMTYHHRSGPVGAVFSAVRARKNGADAAAPIGVVGLGAGAVTAYARPKQSYTFYETDPALKGLVADSDKYFTYIADARKRGATIDIHTGDVRKNLQKDTDRKFAVLFVEMFDTEFDPGLRLTLEAVKLYADRVTPDGVVALHISNAYFRLEPMVAQIAKELKLEGLVWHDDGDRRPGKVAASWVVLSRDSKALAALEKSSPAVGEPSNFRPLTFVIGIKARRDGDTEWPRELRLPGPPPFKK